MRKRLFLAVTGDVRASSNIDTRNGYGRGLRLIDTALDALELPSGQRQDWAVRVLDRDERTMAMLKYNKGTNGETSWILAEVTYTSEGTQDWAQLQIGHRADGTRFIDAQAPFRASSTANFLNGLTVSGAKATFNHDIEANGALSVAKTLTAEGNITAEGVISAGRFGVNASGNVFRTNISGLTKGTNPSSQVSAYLGFFDQNGISGAANGLGQISFVYDTDGGTSMRISSYKSDPSAISTNVFTVGWTGAGSKYVTAQGNFTADSIRSNGSLTAAGSATFLNGASISSGDVVCGDQSMFVGKGTVNFAHQDSVIVTGQNPTNEQQRWPLAVYDKNNAALAYCKFTMRTTGTKEWAFCVAHPKSNGSGNNLGGLVVTCDANGKYGTAGVTADASSNSSDLATTFWVRRYIWTASESQLVHIVNDETISGTKTFTNAIRGDAITLIQTTPWEDVSIADTSRTATATKMLAVVQDKDNKRFAGIEVSALSDGKRYLHVTMRRRDDSGWVSPFKAVEMVDGTTYCEGAHHPPAGDVSYKFATTGWVEDRIGSTIPAGAICYFAQKSIPSGWLLCNGSNVSRTTYARLFAAIGTSWGSGDGRTTFKLPNLHAKFAQGTTTTSEVGQSVEAGLPNITGQITSYELGRAGGAAAGALYDDGSAKYGVSRDSGSGNHDGQSLVITLEASRSSSIYGGSTTVQPPAIRLLPCIKY